MRSPKFAWGSIFFGELSLPGGLSRQPNKRDAVPLGLAWQVLSGYTAGMTKYLQLSPEDRAQIAREAAQLARMVEHVTAPMAVSITGNSRTTVYEFMARHPKACVIGGDGRRRVSVAWLNAWTSGRHALAAMERASK